MAEKVMIELVSHGIGRDESHEILRSASFEAIANGEELIDVALEHLQSLLRSVLKNLEAMFDPANHIGVSGEIVDEAVAWLVNAIQ